MAVIYGFCGDNKCKREVIGREEYTNDSEYINNELSTMQGQINAALNIATGVSQDFEAFSQDTGWLTLSMPTTKNLVTFGPIYYRKIGNRVTVTGIINKIQSVSGQILFRTITVMPDGYRPKYGVETTLGCKWVYPYVTSQNAMGINYLRIRSDGQVTVYSALADNTLSDSTDVDLTLNAVFEVSYLVD